MLDVGVEETMTMVLQIFLPPLALDQLMDTDPDLVSISIFNMYTIEKPYKPLVLDSDVTC